MDLVSSRDESFSGGGVVGSAFAGMGSALGGTDFEWAKTGDLRTQYMGDARENQPEQNEALLGNDLDSVATDPQFQV